MFLLLYFWILISFVYLLKTTHAKLDIFCLFVCFASHFCYGSFSEQSNVSIITLKSGKCFIMFSFAFSKSKSIPFALQEKIPNLTSGSRSFLLGGTPDTTSFSIIVLLYLFRKKWWWWWSWIFVVALLLGICDRFRSFRARFLVSRPLSLNLAVRCRFGAARAAPRARMQAVVSRNLMTSWNNSLTLVHSLPSPLRAQFLSPLPPRCALRTKSSLSPVPFLRPNQSTSLESVHLSRVSLSLSLSFVRSSGGPNSFPFSWSLFCGVLLLLLSRALVFAFLRFLFLNLYLYFIFTKIYTNRLRIVINFN